MRRIRDLFVTAELWPVVNTQYIYLVNGITDRISRRHLQVSAFLAVNSYARAKGVDIAYKTNVKELGRRKCES